MGESEARGVLLAIGGVNANVLAFAIGISLVVQQLTSSYDTARAMRLHVRRSATFLTVYVLVGLVMPLGFAIWWSSATSVVAALATSTLLLLGTVIFANFAGRTARPEALVELMMERSRKGIRRATRLRRQRDASEAMRRLRQSPAGEQATRALWKILDDLTRVRGTGDLLDWGGRDPFPDFAGIPDGRMAEWRHRRREKLRNGRDELAVTTLRNIVEPTSGQHTGAALSLFMEELDNQPFPRDVGSRIVRIALSRVATDITMDALRDGCLRTMTREPAQALYAARLYSGVATWRLWVLARLTNDSVGTYDESQDLAQRSAALASELLLNLADEEIPREYARRSQVVSTVAALLTGSQMVAMDHEDAHVEPALTVLNELHERLLEGRRSGTKHEAMLALRRLRVLHLAHVAMLAASRRRCTLHLDDGKSIFAAYLDQVQRALSRKDRAASRLQVDVVDTAISRKFDETDLLQVTRRMLGPLQDRNGDAQRYSVLRLLADALPNLEVTNAQIRRRSKRNDYVSTIDLRENLGVTYPLAAWPDRPQLAHGRPDAELTRLLDAWSEAIVAQSRLRDWQKDSVDGRAAAASLVDKAKCECERRRATLESRAIAVQKGASTPAEVRVAAWGKEAAAWLASAPDASERSRGLSVLVPVEEEDRIRRNKELALADSSDGRFEFEDHWGRAHGWREPWRRAFPDGHFERLGYLPKRGTSKQYRFFHAASGQGQIAIVFKDGSEALLRASGTEAQDLRRRADPDYGPDWSAKYVLPAVVGDALGPLANCLACLGVRSQHSLVSCAECGGTGKLPEAEMQSVRDVIWNAVVDCVGNSRRMSAGELRRAVGVALS